MASKIQVDKISRNSGTPEFTIPTADGAANTFLKTDGSGVPEPLAILSTLILLAILLFISFYYL